MTGIVAELYTTVGEGIGVGLRVRSSRRVNETLNWFDYSDNMQTMAQL